MLLPLLIIAIYSVFVEGACRYDYTMDRYTNQMDPIPSFTSSYNNIMFDDFTFDLRGSPEVLVEVPLGFNFTHYGQSYNRVYISRFGYISFSTKQVDSKIGPTYFPNLPGVPMNMIALWWDITPIPMGTVGWSRSISYILEPDRFKLAYVDQFMEVELTLVGRDMNTVSIHFNNVAPEALKNNRISGMNNQDGTESITYRESNTYYDGITYDYVTQIYNPRNCSGYGVCDVVNDICLCENDRLGDFCEHCKCACPIPAMVCDSASCVKCAVETSLCSCTVEYSCDSFDSTCHDNPKYNPDYTNCMEYPYTPTFTKTCTLNNFICYTDTAFCDPVSGCQTGYKEDWSLGELLCVECESCLHDGSYKSQTQCCSCPSGYNGATCQYSDQSDCNGHGQVQYDGICVCQAPYEGVSCELCNYYSTNGAIYCNSPCNVNCNAVGGTCVNDTCVCTDSFEGEFCDRCKADYYSTDCSVFCNPGSTCNGFGTCNNDGTCTCSGNFDAANNCNNCIDGFFGSNCDSCPSTSIGICDNAGTCDDGFNGTGLCTCANKRYGTSCEFTKPTVSSISPNFASLNGLDGEQPIILTIKGNDMDNGPISVRIGSNERECIHKSVSSTRITCELPIGTSGRSNISISLDAYEYNTYRIDYLSPVISNAVVLSQHGVNVGSLSALYNSKNVVVLTGSFGLKEDTKVYYHGNSDMNEIFNFTVSATTITFNESDILCNERSLNNVINFFVFNNNITNLYYDSKELKVATPHINDTVGIPGKNGGKVILFGSDFGCDQSKIVVKKTDWENTKFDITDILLLNESTIVANISSGIGLYSLQVYVGDTRVSNSVSMSYPEPYITSVTGCAVNDIVLGTTSECQFLTQERITISGANFDSNNEPVVKVDGFTCSIPLSDPLSYTDSSIICELAVYQHGFDLEVTVKIDAYDTTLRVNAVSFIGGIILPNTLQYVGYSLNPFIGNHHIVANSTLGGDMVTFVTKNFYEYLPPKVESLIKFGKPVDGVLIYSYSCNNIVWKTFQQFRGVTGDFANVTCEISPGVGKDLQFQLEYTDGQEGSTTYFKSPLLLPSEDRISFPPPTLSNGTLHLNGSYPIHDVNGISHIIGTTNSKELFVIRGSNFGTDPSLVILDYFSDNVTYTADILLQGGINDTMIYAETVWGEGGPYTFRITVGEQNATGFDTFLYPSPPEVISVSGCSNNNVDCPTNADDHRIYIYGKNFGLLDTRVYVGGIDCYSLKVEEPYVNVSCVLPKNVGIDKVVSVERDGITSNPTNINSVLSYAPPTVESLSSGNCYGSELTLTNCDRTSTFQITIFGTDFGLSSAKVFVGDKACSNVEHTSDTKLTCYAEKGTEVNLPIFVLQNKGSISSAVNISLSYLQCESGTYQDANGNCQSCKAGYYSSTEGLSECFPCPPGTYANSDGATICERCDRGSYANESNSEVCQTCDIGKYANTKGLAECIECPWGRYIDITGAYECIECEAGKFILSNTTQPKDHCTECAIGSASSYAGQWVDCIKCASNSVAPSVGLTSCVDCSAGSFANDDRSGCVNCTVGKYSSAENCVDCPAGKYAELEGSAECTPCPMGQYQSSESATSCDICSAGKYVSLTGRTTCDKCPVGKYSIEGQSVCEQCPEGEYQSDEGQVECISCVPGKYQSMKGFNTCLDCLAGTYSEDVGSTTCKPCLPGFYSSIAGQEKCNLCENGKYMSLAGAKSCLPCNSGTFAVEGNNTECTSCEAGKYASGTQSSFCSLCGDGTYSDKSADSCRPCTSGSYSIGEIGKKSCELCEVNSFQELGNQDTCNNCSAGYESVYKGATLCSQCQAGKFSSSHGLPCKLCPVGKYKDFVLGEPNTLCDESPAGQFNELEGGTAPTSCKAGTYTFAAGTDGACWNDVIQNYECCKCPKGRFTDHEASMSCNECPVGKFASTEGLSVCENCPTGTYQNNSASTSCISCKAGKYTADKESISCRLSGVGHYVFGTGQIRQVPCEEGTYQDEEGKSECKQCGPGQFQTEIQASSCNDCPTGSFNSGKGQTECFDCTAGTFMNDTGADACIACDIGKSSSDTAQTVCDICEVGTYAPYEGLDKCIKCPVGRSTNKNGTTSECTSCVVGKFQENPGQDTCVDCPPGKYSNVNASSSCIHCAKGYYANLSRSDACDPCPTGRYTADVGKSLCDECPKGRYTDIEGTFECTECPSGKYNDKLGQEACITCDDGYYHTGVGGQECTIAEKGTIAVLGEQSLCTGETVQPEEGQSTCIPCVVNSIADDMNEGCLCQAGYYLHTIVDGYTGTNIDDNGNVETVVLGDWFECRPCPEGADCSAVGSTFDNLITSKGWWRSGNSSLVFYQCQQAIHCAGGMTSSDESLCSDGRTGPLCSLCLPNYSLLANGLCGPCPDTTDESLYYFATILGGFLVGFAIFFWYYLRRDKILFNLIEHQLQGDSTEETKEGSKDDEPIDSSDIELDTLGEERVVGNIKNQNGVVTPFGFTINNVEQLSKSKDPALRSFTNNQQVKVLVGLYQILSGLTTTLIFPWPNGFKNAISSLGFLNFQFMEVTSAECVTTVNFFTTYLTYCFAPVGVVCLFLFFWVFPSIIYVKKTSIYDQEQRKQQIHLLRLKFVKVWYIFLFLAFPRLAATILQVYGCQKIENEYFLKADLSIQCFQGEWNFWAVVNILPVLLYPIGIPLLFMFLLHRTYDSNLFQDRETQYTIGLMFLPYRQDMWWFELVDMSHKLFMTSVLGLLPLPWEMPIGMALAVSYLILIILGNPYEEITDYRLHIMAQVEILLCILAEYVFYEENMWHDSQSDLLFSVVLCMLMIFFLAMFVYNVLKKIARQRWVVQLVGKVKPYCLGMCFPCLWVVRTLSVDDGNKEVIPIPPIRLRMKITR